MSCSPPEAIRIATPADIDAIVDVINAAFRQAEAFFIERSRISREEVAKYFESGEFLIIEAVRKLAGCVYVEARGEVGYFGLLAVSPAAQRQGIGKKLIAAAEERCKAFGCRAVEIRVVDLRTELPPLYRRLGYVEIGSAPFPQGIKTKLDCHFIVMAKNL